MAWHGPAPEHKSTSGSKVGHLTRGVKLCVNSCHTAHKPHFVCVCVLEILQALAIQKWTFCVHFTAHIQPNELFHLVFSFYVNKVVFIFSMQIIIWSLFYFFLLLLFFLSFSRLLFLFSQFCIRWCVSVCIEYCCCLASIVGTEDCWPSMAVLWLRCCSFNCPKLKISVISMHECGRNRIEEIFPVYCWCFVKITWNGKSTTQTDPTKRKRLTRIN